MLKYSNKKMY